MKNVVRLVLAVIVGLVLSGCNETPTLYNSDNYKGEAMRIADGIYLKKVYIQGMYALLQCDKNGNIIQNQNIGTGYNQGKTFISTAVITPTSTETGDAKFNFKCSEINDCYNQVVIVKNSIKK